jgi:hypothetical protein
MRHGGTSSRSITIPTSYRPRLRAIVDLRRISAVRHFTNRCRFSKRAPQPSIARRSAPPMLYQGILHSTDMLDCASSLPLHSALLSADRLIGHMTQGSAK